jgi:glycosyltransferase involved in cell wall biosynthesis
VRSSRPAVRLIIPAYDEEGAIGGVVAGFVAAADAAGRRLLDEVIVVDNNSRDRTAEVARAAGATVVAERRPGYGSACLRGLAELRARAMAASDLVVFADGDGSNDPGDLAALLAPLLDGEAQLVIGSRPRRADAGSLTPPQRFGNVLACRLMNARWGTHYTDLGPFRAVRWDALERIGMVDRDYGWTVEMQVKAARLGLHLREVDVANRVRVAGRSKVSGTLKGVVFAGAKIIGTIARHA